MNTKKYMYAAIGAPVLLAKQTQDKIEDLRAKAGDSALAFSKTARNQVTTWSKEGEKFIGTVSDSKRLDELTSKVDLDQAKEQVNKLRDQLDDLLATWKTNFRPEGKVVAKEKVVVEAPTAKALVAKKPATRKPAAKAPVAKKPATRKPAAKAPVAKKPATRKPTAKAPVAKAS